VDHTLTKLGLTYDSSNCKADVRDWMFAITCSSSTPFSDSWFKDQGFSSTPTSGNLMTTDLNSFIEGKDK